MPEDSVQRLLARLKELRAARGLTQEEFAERSGISYKYYQAVEAGRKNNLRLATLDRLAKAYGLEAWQLILPGGKQETAKVGKAAKKPAPPKKRPPSKGL